MKITNKFLSLILTLCFIIPAGITVSAQTETQYSGDGIVWDFCSSDAISSAAAAVGSPTCGPISIDTTFVNSYSVSATFTTNTTRRMLVKLPNNTIQQKDSNGNYVYNYLHVLVGNPQNKPVTFGCGIITTSQNAQVTLPANSWTVASFYIEDLFTAGNSNYKRDGKNYGESVEGVAFQMSEQAGGNNPTTAGIKFNLDKIWVTPEPLPGFEIKTVTPENNYTKISAIDTRFVFEFGRELKPITPVVLAESLMSEDGDLADATLSVFGNKAIVTANEVLKPDTSYTFDSGDTVIKDVYGVKYSQKLTYRFKTDSAPLLISDVRVENTVGSEVYSIPSSGEVVLAAKGINYSNSDAGAVIVANVKDEISGISQLLYGTDTVLCASMSSAEPISSLSLSVDSNSGITALVVDNLENCRPISNSYIVLSSGDVFCDVVYPGDDEYSDVSVTLNEPTLLLDTLTISGEITGDINGIVNIVVREKVSNDIKLIMPVKATNGSFSYDYIFDGSGSGKYEISAVPRAEAETARCEVTYLGATTKETIRATFDDNSVTPDSALSILQTYRDGIGIPSAYTDELLLHIANTLCEQKPYNEYSDFIEILNTSVKALEDINNASWSSYKTVFNAYPLILNNDETLSLYSTYSEIDKAEIYKIAINRAPFSDFISLRKAIVDATVLYTRNLQQQRPQSGGGSSGSSFGGGSVTIGGGSTSGELKDKAQAPVADSPSGKAEFSDVSESHWAYPAINELASRNIISGYNDGTFAGDKPVSRAEFVKMLTGCFTYAEANGEDFTDVPADAWYFQYLARASSAGIVKGNDGLFMPDVSITRQDAALMIYRSFMYKGISLSGSKQFVDFTDISDYAGESVSVLGNIGIISGYEDGSFGPKNNITRFETAQLIYKVIEFMSGGAAK